MNKMAKNDGKIAKIVEKWPELNKIAQNDGKIA